MRATQLLLTSAEELWASYSRHPFVLGIQTGTLEREKFRRYILQDDLYLEDYARVFALGAAKARSLETANLFAAYLLAMNRERDIHSGYLEKFGVTEDQRRSVPRALDNLSYTSYMLRVAYEEGETEILTAILSCAYSYEVIAKKMVEARPAAAEHPFYGPWVRGYASAEYAAENARLLETLDRLAAPCTSEQLRHLTDIFLTCSRYELAFWEMAWRMSR
jgi:thiaminase/transcriptional activator TenA